jgi:hypothetical protein
MLRVNPRERPTAAQALMMNEIHEKIASFHAQQRLKPEIENILLNTIKVPQALKKLNEVLPRPCYPEAVQQAPPRPPLPPGIENDVPKDSSSVKESAVREAKPSARHPQPPVERSKLMQNNVNQHRIHVQNYAR